MPVLKSPACGKPQAALLMCALKGGNPGYESALRVTLALRQIEWVGSRMPWSRHAPGRSLGWTRISCFHSR